MDLVVFAAQGPEGGERTLARRLLALALERELGITAVPPIEREPGGKPFFPDRPDICFNLSHSRGAAVCALHHRPVGVDVERLRPPPRRLAGEMGAEEFFRMWTAKEASVKRRGLGLAALLRPLEPDPLCRYLEGLLAGCAVTVCPSVETEVRTVLAEMRGESLATE